MNKRFIHLSRVAAIALVAALAGCSTVTKEQFDAVSATANNALTEARAAKAAADAAQKAASDAAYAAQQAQSAADSANQCCADNKAAIDRLLERNLRK